MTDSVIQVADKSSGGKKQRFLRAQEAWEDRVTDPVERRGRRAIGDTGANRFGMSWRSWGTSFSGKSGPTAASMLEYAAASREKPTFLLSKGAQNSDRASSGGKTVGRSRL